ncbi:MAG: class I SAM-dependent methyltransferase [Planctomycetes bacterium]|nr:class I SAM-dependent methyltransferase [Planctomycetota bacterium]
MQVSQAGNAHSRSRLRQRLFHQAHVDAFDYAEKMIERAKASVGETNNRFFQDNLLDPKQVRGTYDAVVCIRVLINIERQKDALRNMIPWVKSAGLLILVEGYQEGFASLSRIRDQVGLPPVQPAKINYYRRTRPRHRSWRHRRHGAGGVAAQAGNVHRPALKSSLDPSVVLRVR